MEILDALSQAVKAGQPVALCTVVQTTGAVPRHAGAKMIVYGDGNTLGTVGGGEIEDRVRNEALEAIKHGKTRLLDYDLIDIEKGDPGLCGGSVKIYIEPFSRQPTVVVVGAGHVGKSVVHLANWLGFRTVLSDDRVELCSEERCPGADEYLPIPITEIPNKITIDSQTYFVLVTRGVDVDAAGLPVILKTETTYIGLIGSSRRWKHTQEKLKSAGLTEAEINHIKSPIGLNIYAETPDEIAVSIMAEIIAHKNHNSGH